MASNIEEVTSLMIILSIALTSILLAIYEYLKNLRGITVKREFMDQLYPILESHHPMDLSNIEDSFITFTREKNAISDGVLVPENLLAHSFILNPVRLAIMRVLFQYNRYISSDLRKELNIPWGNYTSHINALNDEGLIISQDEFVGDKVMKILYLEAKGRVNFTDLQKSLKAIVQ